MTDKGTIIDGVAVSGCGFLDEWKHCDLCQSLIKTFDGRTKCLTEPDLRCETFPNCIYKQSARKDERIKSLQGELWAEKKILTELDQENAELKEHDSDSWKNVASMYKVEYRKAEEKLSQIAELADKCKVQQCSKKTCGYLDDSTDDIYGCIEEECEFYLLQQIKQIAQGE